MTWTNYRPQTELCDVAAKYRLTRSQAKSQAKRIEHKTGNPMNVWKCRACGGWHIGRRRT